MNSVIPWEFIHHYWWLWLILFLASLANLLLVRLKRFKELQSQLKISNSVYDLTAIELEIECVWIGFTAVSIFLFGLALAVCSFHFYTL